MTIKLVALDLDNTLLNGQSRISPRNERVLKQLHANGMKVVLTTGRPIKGILPFIKQLELTDDEDYSINFNGGLVERNSDRKVIFSRYITKDDIRPINQLAQEMRFPLDGITIDRAFSVIDIRKSGYQSFIGDLMPFTDVTFAALPEKKFFKFVSQTDAAQVQAIQNATQSNLDLTIVKSRPNLLEFLPNGVNKSLGLGKLLDHFGWTFENVMSFGDEENDLPMIKAAGVGVAMENAIPSVKAVSNATTKNNLEDGVAVFLEHYFNL
ncbi:MAG: Cof-type HAD-IIB family hydrolase [Oenococcus sp.]|uniref:Cof-type HAD-IIB family hydrolase n=1 Tax=Oenococcus sp. TaxID=1979414 RepID=UPI0039ECC7D1